MAALGIPPINLKILMGIGLALLMACHQHPGDPANQSETKHDIELSRADSVPVMEDIDKAYLMGKFVPSAHPKFVHVSTTLADRSGMFLRKEAYQAFERMYASALQDSVRLVIRSATRNFDDQKNIWERKWRGTTILSEGIDASKINDPGDRAKKILNWSSMPGSSRHHWGADIDLNSFDNEYFEHGEGQKVYEWLSQHAASYGFDRPYTNKSIEGRKGYNEEKWHWTYLPLSRQFLKMADSLLTDDDFHGFEGSQTAPMVGIKDNYIMGVASSCHPEIKKNTIH